MKNILLASTTWLLAAFLAMTASAAQSNTYIYTSDSKLKITGGEMLANGDFSNDFQQWHTEADAWIWVANGGPSGDNAAQAVADGQLAYACDLQTGTYALTFYTKGAQDHVVAANINIYYSNSNGDWDGTDKVQDIANQLPIAPDWTQHCVKLNVSQPLCLTVSMRNMTAGTMVAGFSLKPAEEVFDSRRLQHFAEYAQAVVASGLFTQDTGGFAAKLVTLSSVLEGIATSERRDQLLGQNIDLDRMEDGNNTLQQLEEDLRLYLDQNSGDLLSMERAWDAYSRVLRANTFGNWESPTKRWSHYDSYGNAIRYEYPQGYELENTCMNYKLVAPYTGTYMFKADVRGLYYCGSYVDDPITPFRSACVYGGLAMPQALASPSELDGDALIWCNSMEQTQYHSSTVFFSAEAGQELNFGVFYLNDQSQQGRKLGGQLFIANPELRLLGYNTNEVEMELIRMSIVDRQKQLQELLDQSSLLAAKTRSEGYLWGRARLMDCREAARQAYEESLTAVDVNGQVVDQEKLTQDTNETLMLYCNDLRKMMSAFEETNRPCVELLQTIDEAYKLDGSNLQIDNSHETLRAAIAEAEAVRDALQESDDDDTIQQERDKAISANQNLKATIDEVRMLNASCDLPYVFALTNPNFNESQDNGNATNVAGWEYSCNNQDDLTKEAFKRTADSDFLGGYRRGVWRGSSVAPASRLSQTVTLRKAGIYEYYVQGYAASEDPTHDQAMWQVVYDEQGNATDTIFNGNSRVKFFVEQKNGGNAAYARVKSHYYGYPLAEGRDANLFTPSWYSVYYVKETDEEEEVAIGMDSFGQLEVDPNGANAYGFGSNNFTYYGTQVQEFYDRLATRLKSTIAEAWTLWADCPPSQAVYRLEKAITNARKALATGTPQDQANAHWALLEAKRDASPTAKPYLTEGERKWDFTRWSQHTKNDLLAEAATVGAPLESNKTNHHSWRAFEKYNATDNMEHANQAYWWGDDTVDGLGELTVGEHLIPETRGLYFNVKKGSLAIAVDYFDEGTGKEAGGQYLWMGGRGNTMTVPNVKPGWYVSIDVASHKKGQLRGLDASIQGFEGMTLALVQGESRVDSLTTCIWRVPESITEDGVDVTFTNNDGCHIYYIKVSEHYFPPVEGQDMTPYIVNASYEQGTDGWSTEGGQDWLNGNYNLRVDWQTCEGWNVSHFDIHQQLRQMPEGIYKMDVQGFYRYDRDNSAYYAYLEAQENGREIDIPVSFYMNGMGRPLKNVFTEPVDSGTVYDWNNMYVYYTPDNRQWFPNSMKASSVAFDAGMYQNSGYGYVSPRDGVLQIGVKGSTNQANDSWAIWDNFRLTYYGKQPEASKNAALQLADETRPMTEQYCNSSLRQQMLQHIETAEQLEPIEDNRDALYQNFLEMLAMRDELSASVELYAQLKAAIDSLQAAANECKRIRPKAEAELNIQYSSQLLQGEGSDEEVRQCISNTLSFAEYVKGAASLPCVDHPRRWDFTNWSQQTRQLLRQSALNVTAPRDSISPEHYSWRAFEKKYDTDSQAHIDKVYWWGWTEPDGRQLNDGNGLIFYETEGIYINKCIAGSIAIAIDYPSTEKGDYAGGQYLWIGGKKQSFYIPDVQPGSIVSIGVESHNQSEGRGLNMTIDGTTYLPVEGTTTPTALTRCVWHVPDTTETALDLLFENTNGCHIYYIEVKMPDSQLVEGQDLTPLILNPYYDQQTYGWRTEGGHDWQNDNVNNQRVDYGTCEAFNIDYFDIHQQLDDMAEGIYKIDLQGFYRYLRWDNAYNAYMEAQENGREIDIPVALYLNGMERPLKNIFTEPVAVGQVYDSSIMSVYTAPDGQSWFPQSMQSSNVAFNAGMYLNCGYGYVSADERVLRLGVKGSTDQGNTSWAIWDNFRLTYCGKQPEASKNAALQLAEQYTSKQGVAYGRDVRESLNSLIASAQQMEASEANREPLYQNFLNLLYAKGQLDASIALFEQLRQAIDSLDLAIQTYTLNKTTVAQAQALLLQVRAGYESEYTDDDARQALEQIAQTIAALRINTPDEICQSVSFAQLGNEVALTSEDGAVIYYTTDNSTPTTQSARYQQPVAIDRFCTIKALATKEEKQPSTVAAYKVEFYFAADTLKTNAAGRLAAALTWPNAKQMERLCIEGSVSTTDFTALRSLDKLQHLDMSPTVLADGMLPNGAFAAMNLVSFVSPKNINNVGTGLFNACNSLAAVQWQAGRMLNNVAMQGVDNPNLLVYVSVKAYAPDNFRNIVVNGVADNIVLVDVMPGKNGNYHCPTAFQAQQISYVHKYEMATKPTVCQGWETLVLPFDVQRVTHATKGVIAPFADSSAGDDVSRFWLYAYSGGGTFQKAASIEALKPYIISMPNNTKYADRYNLSGEVTFSAANVEVGVTPEGGLTQQGSQFSLTPTFRTQPQDESVLVLNIRNSRFDYNGWANPGSIFRGALREAMPFEAYATLPTGSAREFLPLSELFDEATAIDAIETVSQPAPEAVYDLGGRKLSQDGSQSQPLKKGVYVRQGRKIVISNNR